MSPVARGRVPALSRVGTVRHVACAFDMAASGIRLWQDCPAGPIRKATVTAALPPVFRPSGRKGASGPCVSQT